MRRVALAVAVAVLLVAAGCSAPGAGPSAGDGTDEVETTTDAAGGAGTVDPTDGDAGAPPDPEADVLGWENGVWYNESIAVTPGNGLNDTELETVVARSMARVEVIRGLEFERDVDVTVLSREEYRDRAPLTFGEDPIEQQTFEALFLVGEDTTVAEVRERLYGTSVAGYYANGRIVLVSDDTTGVEVNPETLAHELTHALQDAQLGRLASSRSRLDERTARTGLVEGEANYVQDRYAERCASEWDCLPTPRTGGGEADADREFGVFLTFYAPYSEGPTLVEALRERADGGWAAVNDAWDAPPRSTEQVIHPDKYPDEAPLEVELADRSSGDWRPVVHDGRRDETVGEAGVFAMLYANGVVPEESLYDDAARYNYSHPASEGWGGDTLRAYRNGDEYGYVWKTVWDSERDARQFQRAHREVLERNGAVAVGESRYRVEDGAFADAVRVVRDGQTVTVVSAPTVEDLADVYGPDGD